ncbi:AI-2E family transporter, partial [Escherichia coli]|uniref:AI-2E family transporter n=1 Tax=Escherichia coli TaxID=562 RepID=UPI00106F9E4E
PATSTKLRYPSPDVSPPPPLYGILLFAALVLCCVGLKSTASLVAPLFLVLTLVITVYPLRAWLVRRRMPQVVATIAALISVYALLAIVLGSVIWSLTKLVTALTEYSAQFTALYEQALAQLSKLGVSTSMLSNA